MKPRIKEWISKGIWRCVLVTIVLPFLVGCRYVKIENEKVRDLTYTVVSEDKLPDELLDQVLEKKESPFKFTFQDGEYLYICQGYGMQKTGGYCIQVKDAYEAKNAIYFGASLLGPSKIEPQTEQPSFPYIVIKTEYQDKVVVFE